MTHSRFQSRFEDLPGVVPIFPLEGVLLLPGGRLPLNIFEPRYVDMVMDTLTENRLIGMVLPRSRLVGSDAPPSPLSDVYSVGCLGRICAFSETDDDRLLITLAGVCRFRLGAELEMEHGYRRVTSDFSEFRADMEDPTGSPVDRQRLLATLRSYLPLHDIALNWKVMENFSDHALVITVSMLCPFETRERQALLEAPTAEARGTLLITLIEMGILEAGGGSTCQ